MKKLPKPMPFEIIDAFYNCMEFIWGAKYTPEYPAKFDVKNAEAWIEKGLTIEVACFVFYHQMSRMHERWLRRPANDRTEIPQGLSIFDEHIENAILRAKNGGVIDCVERSNSQWRARIKNWMAGLPWHRNMWGNPPIDIKTGSISKNSRAPQDIVREFLPVDISKLGSVMDAGG